MIRIENLLFRYRDGGFTLAIERLEIEREGKLAAGDHSLSLLLQQRLQ